MRTSAGNGVRCGPRFHFGAEYNTAARAGGYRAVPGDARVGCHPVLDTGAPDVGAGLFEYSGKSTNPSAGDATDALQLDREFFNCCGGISKCNDFHHAIRTSAGERTDLHRIESQSRGGEDDRNIEYRGCPEQIETARPFDRRRY